MTNQQVRNTEMASLKRFTVSIPKKLVDQFDAQSQREGYPTRSKAIADLIAQSLVKQEWKESSNVAAAIILVYDHHKRNLSNELTRIQHDYHTLIISSQHVHLDHDNCFELIVTRGKAEDIERLFHKIKSVKGVKYATLAAASTGKSL